MYCTQHLHRCETCHHNIFSTTWTSTPLSATFTSTSSSTPPPLIIIMGNMVVFLSPAEAHLHSAGNRWLLEGPGTLPM